MYNGSCGIFIYARPYPEQERLYSTGVNDCRDRWFRRSQQRGWGGQFIDPKRGAGYDAIHTVSRPRGYSALRAADTPANAGV